MISFYSFYVSEMSLLSKLNKDELILIIENIEEKHKKEIRKRLVKLRDDYEYIIDGCRRLSNLEFKQCHMYDCKALKIRKARNPQRYKDIRCEELFKCPICKVYVCNRHFDKCKCSK